METLVAVVQHRNEYYSRGKPHVSGPSKGFGDLNCRAFESSSGCLLSPPLRACSPKTPTPSNSRRKDGIVSSKKDDKSSPVAIHFKSGEKEGIWNNNNAPFSERWAGPAYSNSPPPSSLPMPKFSLKAKRTVSLELPPVEPEVELHAFAKSAPASPTRELTPSAIRFLCDDDSATKTLRRILNLDIAD